MCVGNIYAHSEVQSPFFMVKSPSTHHFSWLNHHQTKRHQLRTRCCGCPLYHSLQSLAHVFLWILFMTELRTKIYQNPKKCDQTKIPKRSQQDPPGFENIASAILSHQSPKFFLEQHLLKRYNKGQEWHT